MSYQHLGSPAGMNVQSSFLSANTTASTDNLDIKINNPESQKHQFSTQDPAGMPPIDEGDSDEQESVCPDTDDHVEIKQPHVLSSEANRLEIDPNHEAGDPISEISKRSAALIESSEYTSNDSREASFESIDSKHVDSHEFFSPSMYNTALYGEKEYLTHKLDLKFKKTGKFCPQRANVNQILLYKDPTMLLHTFFEEPQNRKLHEGTDKELFYEAEHSQKRFIEGYNVMKFGYGKATLTKCKIRLNRTKSKLIVISDTRNVFKISEMLGILIGQKTGTFLQNFRIVKEAHFFYPWQCMSIVMRDRTLDFGCKVQSHLIDIWVGLSELIIAQNGCTPATMIHGNRATFNLTVVKQKIFEECRERELNMNDLFLLGMLRAMKMQLIPHSDEQYKKILNHIKRRYKGGSKFYRITKMIYEVGHLIYRRAPRQTIAEKVNMRNEIRRMILFGLMTERLKKQQHTPSRLRKINLSFANYKNLVALQSVVHIENQKILNSMRVSPYDAQNPKRQFAQDLNPKEASLVMLKKYRTLPLQRFLDTIDNAIEADKKKKEASSAGLPSQAQSQFIEREKLDLPQIKSSYSEMSKIKKPVSEEEEYAEPIKAPQEKISVTETALEQMPTARELHMDSSTEQPSTELRSGQNQFIVRLTQPMVLDDSVIEEDD